MVGRLPLRESCTPELRRKALSCFVAVGRFNVDLTPNEIDNAGRCQRNCDDRESHHIDHGSSPGLPWCEYH